MKFCPFTHFLLIHSCTTGYAFVDIFFKDTPLSTNLIFKDTGDESDVSNKSNFLRLFFLSSRLSSLTCFNTSTFVFISVQLVLNNLRHNQIYVALRQLISTSPKVQQSTVHNRANITGLKKYSGRSSRQNNYFYKRCAYKRKVNCDIDIKQFKLKSDTFFYVLMHELRNSCQRKYIYLVMNNLIEM